MAEVLVTTPLTEQKKSDEETMIKTMEQNLKGVMFHTFETDLYCLLDLKGFKKMHKYQMQEESENLEELKHKYIKAYGKLPILEYKEETNLWKEHSTLIKENISHEQISKIVKKSMEDYANWETEVLEHLLKWKRVSQDRQMIHLMIEDVMREIKYVETIITILDEHSYHYDCICEMSDYLCTVYK